jgi:hypothetical protein
MLGPPGPRYAIDGRFISSCSSDFKTDPIRASGVVGEHAKGWQGIVQLEWHYQREENSLSRCRTNADHWCGNQPAVLRRNPTRLEMRFVL